MKKTSSALLFSLLATLSLTGTGCDLFGGGDDAPKSESGTTVGCLSEGVCIDYETNISKDADALCSGAEYFEDGCPSDYTAEATLLATCTNSGSQGEFEYTSTIYITQNYVDALITTAAGNCATGVAAAQLTCTGQTLNDSGLASYCDTQ